MKEFGGGGNVGDFMFLYNLEFAPGGLFFKKIYKKKGERK